MKVTNNEDVLARVLQLISVITEGTYTARLCCVLDEYTPDDEAILSLVECIREQHPVIKDDTLMLMATVIDAVNSFYWEVSDVDNLMDRILDNAKIFDTEYFSNAPYFKNILGKCAESGELTLATLNTKYGELLQYSSCHISEDYVVTPMLGIYSHNVKLPVLLLNRAVWKTVSPFDIETTKKPLSDAYGDILVLGCKLGYYAYTASFNSNVSSITIVDNNPDILYIFKKCILPSMPQDVTVTLINADAVDFMNKCEDGAYDYCFVDLWRDHTDTIMYKSIKDVCKRFKNTQIYYWIEEMICYYIANGVLARILYDMHGMNGMSEFMINCEELDSIDIVCASDVDRCMSFEVLTKLYELL